MADHNTPLYEDHPWLQNILTDDLDFDFPLFPGILPPNFVEAPITARQTCKNYIRETYRVEAETRLFPACEETEMRPQLEEIQNCTAHMLEVAIGMEGRVRRYGELVQAWTMEIEAAAHAS